MSNYSIQPAISSFVPSLWMVLHFLECLIILSSQLSLHSFVHCGWFFTYLHALLFYPASYLFILSFIVDGSSLSCMSNYSIQPAISSFVRSLWMVLHLLAGLIIIILSSQLSLHSFVHCGWFFTYLHALLFYPGSYLFIRSFIVDGSSLSCMSYYSIQPWSYLFIRSFNLAHLFVPMFKLPIAVHRFITSFMS